MKDEFRRDLIDGIAELLRDAQDAQQLRVLIQAANARISELETLVMQLGSGVSVQRNPARAALVMKMVVDEGMIAALRHPNAVAHHIAARVYSEMSGAINRKFGREGGE